MFLENLYVHFNEDPITHKKKKKHFISSHELAPYFIGLSPFTIKFSYYSCGLSLERA